MVVTSGIFDDLDQRGSVFAILIFKKKDLNRLYSQLRPNGPVIEKLLLVGELLIIIYVD